MTLEYGLGLLAIGMTLTIVVPLILNYIRLKVLEYEKRKKEEEEINKRFK